MRELRRLLRGRLFAFLGLLLIFNFSLMYLSCDENKEITLSGEALEKYIAEYPDFINRTVENGNKISSLPVYSDGFAKGNISASTKAYEALSDVVPVFGENRGIVVYSDFRVSDAILIGLIAVIAIWLTAERDNGLSALTRSTKHGRTALYLTRSAILLLFSVGFSALFTISSVSAAFVSFGFTDLFRPVQSIPEFKLCTYRITILDYLIISALLKAFAAFITGIIIHTLSLIVRRAVSVIITAVILLVSIISYGAVIPTAEYNHIKYINISAMLFSDCFFKEHVNLNFFSLPVNFLFGAAAVSATLAVIIIITGWVAQVKIYPKTSFGENRIVLKTRKLIFNKLPSLPMFMHEGKKLMVYQAGIIFIAATFICAFASVTQYRYIYVIDWEQDKWYDYFRGDITEDLCIRMQDEYDSLTEQIEEMQEQIDRENAKEEPDIHALAAYISRLNYDIIVQDALKPVLENAYDAVAYTEKTGIVIQNINPYQYNLLLTQDTKTTYLLSVYILIGIICAVSGVFSCENSSNMRSLIRTTKNGRRRNITAKLVWAGIAAIIITVSVFLTHYLYIDELFLGFDHLDAVAQSIPCIRNFPFKVTIREFIIILFALRALGGVVIALIASAVSKLCSDKSTAICISSLLLALPSVLLGGLGVFIPTDIISALYLVIPQ